MKAKNKVISNEWFRNCDIAISNNNLIIKPYDILLNKDTIGNYMVVEQKDGKSATRGIIGGTMFGVVGAIIGSSNAKVQSINTIMIRLKDGKDFTMEIDDEKYKILMMSLF